jgi:acyl CoA:acetate/3-ketoacid CoA transferase
VIERAVFWHSSESDVVKLIEVSPGDNLQKDVLDQMKFVTQSNLQKGVLDQMEFVTPVISSNFTIMDPHIFKPEKMNLAGDFFGSLEERCIYQRIIPCIVIFLVSHSITRTMSNGSWVV